MPESTMYVHVLPPGEKEQITCDACSGTEFNIFTESRDGNISMFRTVCAGCGKRGGFTSQVETTITRKFTQFADMPDTPSSITVTGGSDDEPPE